MKILFNFLITLIAVLTCMGTEVPDTRTEVSISDDELVDTFSLFVDDSKVLELKEKESAFARDWTELPDPIDYRGALAQFETENASLLAHRAASREQEKTRFRANAPDLSSVVALRPDAPTAGSVVTVSDELMTGWREFASAIADLPPDEIRYALATHGEAIDSAFEPPSHHWNSTLALTRVEALQTELADVRAERAALGLARQSPESATGSDLRLELQEAQLEAAIQGNPGAFRNRLSELEPLLQKPSYNSPERPGDSESPQL